MAKGDKWLTFWIYKTKKDAQRASGGKKGWRVTKASKSDYTKGSGFRLSRLWTPVKGQKDHWGNQLFKPKN